MPPITIGVALPQWFITPSRFKDGAGSEGGTIQGRITAKNPSIQTFPVPIRKCIRSRWRLGTVVSFDMSQIELRVAALISGCPTLVSTYQQDLDLHRDRAVTIFGPSVLSDPSFGSGDPRTDKRQVAKTVNFADLFRSGADTMQATILEMTGTIYPITHFQNIVATRNIVRPGLWAWQENLIRTTIGHWASGSLSFTSAFDIPSHLRRKARWIPGSGVHILPFIGQSRFFSAHKPSKDGTYEVNELVNFPIQTTASNLLLQIQAALHRTLPSLNAPFPDFVMTHQVYDAVYFDVRRPHLVGDLQALWAAAVDSTLQPPSGYWHLLQQHYKTEIPLKYGTHVKAD